MPFDSFVCPVSERETRVDFTDEYREAIKESITRIRGNLRGGTLLFADFEKHAKKIREITSFESPVSPIKESQEKSIDTSLLFLLQLQCAFAIVLRNVIRIFFLPSIIKRKGAQHFSILQYLNENKMNVFNNEMSNYHTCILTNYISLRISLSTEKFIYLQK